MTVRSGHHPFAFRDLFDRYGPVSIQRRVGGSFRVYLKIAKHTTWSRRVWSFLVGLTERGEVLLFDRSEQFRQLCPNCREETPHQGFDELGFGWFAQISRCRQCGRQHMKVWALA